MNRRKSPSLLSFRVDEATLDDIERIRQVLIAASPLGVQVTKSEAIRHALAVTAGRTSGVRGKSRR